MPEKTRRPYRAFRGSEGFDILVGRDAEDNDTLTFDVAAPEDFWLHVAGTEGSHVVVKNPERTERLPRTTLREAAALAAYFSKARGAGKVSVHHTTVRHVSKRRGMPRGMVELADWDAVSVRPEIPAAVQLQA